MKKEAILLRKLFEIHKIMTIVSKDTETCCGISVPQCHAIIELGVMPETNLKTLAGSLGLDKSTLSRTIDTLVEEKLVERVDSRKDRREVVLRLSARGEKKYHELYDPWYRFCKELLDHVPDGKHDLVIEAVTLLVEAYWNNPEMQNFGK